MSYTVDHFYKKVLEGTDKMGSDFFTLQYVMNRLETATYDFIGGTVKFIENTQEIRDDLLPLYKSYKINVVITGDSKKVALPTDYLHLMSARVIDENVTVRETSIIRHGQDEIYMTDPDTKPTAQYPIISLADSYMDVLSPGMPLWVEGFYLKKPTFGKYSPQDDTEQEIAVNLPDHSTEKIIKILINDIFQATGDARFQMQYQGRKVFRNRKE